MGASKEKCEEQENLQPSPPSERAGHRLQAGSGREAVFAWELPRGNARTGRPPLKGNECAGLAREAGWYHGSSPFVPRHGMKGVFLLHFIPINNSQKEEAIHMKEKLEQLGYKMEKYIPENGMEEDKK